MKEKVIMFYTRYVDDTLLITKKKDTNYVLNQFNNFNKNLKFTIDTSENSAPHFLDIAICPNGLDIYYKHTQTGEYVHVICTSYGGTRYIYEYVPPMHYVQGICTSYALCTWKTSWIHSLLIRAKKICSTNQFNNKIQLINRYAAWNCYPRNVVNGIIKYALRKNDNNNTFNDNDIDAVRIYNKIKYSEETAGRLIKKYKKKLYECFKNERGVQFVLQYETLNYIILPTQKIKFRY